MLSRLRLVGIGVAAAIQATGCFAYRPLDAGGVRGGEVVRVAITPRGAEELTRQVGPRVESLGGRMLRPRDTTLVVAVSELTRARGTEEFWTGDSVSVPLSSVGALFVRRFDPTRTLLAVTGAAVGILLVRRAIDEAGLFGGSVGRQPGSR